MSYALRNSLILGILLCVVWGIGYYWVGMRQVGKIETLQASQEALKEELVNASSVLAIYDTTLAQLNRMKVRWQERKRFVPTRDTPGHTLVYLDELLKQAKGNVSYDFLFKGRKDEETYSAHVYGLEGEAKFENLYALVWHLEHGPRFYTVDRLQVDYGEPETGQSLPRWDWVTFRMVFRAYFNPHSQIEDSIPMPGAEQPARLARSLFSPLITKYLPPNRLGQLEVESTQLKGLTHELAYLEDALGQLHIMRRGERVYLGWLDKIDIYSNRVEFVLNKGGIWERFTLRIGPRNSRK